MPFHIDWNSAGLSMVWHDFRGPLIGLAVALVMALAGRFLRSGLLAASAGGAGVVAGWYAIGGRLWMTAPRPSVDFLPMAAAAVLVIGLVSAWLGRSRGAILGSVLAATFIGWWLCGAPRTQSDLLQVWPIAVGAGTAVLLYVRSLSTATLDPWRLALTGLTMAAAFHVVSLPPMWTQLALVPAATGLALLALPPMPGLVALPIAADIAAAASLAVIAFGRLPDLRLGPADVAAMSPLLALWLAPHLAGRLGFAGRAASGCASLLSALLAIAAAWIAFRALPR